MRLMFWLSLGAALLALGLAFAPLTRLHLTKVSTEQALASIERSAIRRETLTPEQRTRLDRDLQIIRDNDRGYQRVGQEVQRLALSGFLALAAINAALAGLAWSWSREAKRSRGESV